MNLRVLSPSRRLALSCLVPLAALAVWLAADAVGRWLVFPPAGPSKAGFLAQRYNHYRFQQPVGQPYLDSRVSMSHERDSDFRQENFALCLEGYLWNWLPGWYGLAVESDDDSRLFVNGVFVVDNSGYHAPRRRETHVWLGAGRHLVELEYAQRGLGACLSLAWRPPGRDWEPLPVGRLRPVARQFSMEQAQAWRQKMDRVMEPLAGALAVSTVLVVLGLWLPLGVWRQRLLGSLTRQDTWLLVMVLATFIVGGAQAWFNPRPGFDPTCRIYPTAPFLWQYDIDSYMNFHTAAHFPKVYAKHPTRINRPLYFGLTRVLAEGVYLAARPVKQLTPYQATFWGFALLKLLIMAGWVLALARLLRPYLEPAAVLLTVGLILAQRFTIMSFATWHTYELQFVSATFIALMVRGLAQNYSHTRNLIFSMLVGLLMLGKQNYGPYLGALLFALCYGRWREVVLSVTAHFIPLAAWIGVLSLMGLTYSNHEAATAGMGTWIWRDFLGASGWEMLNTLRRFWLWYFSHTTSWAILAGMGLVWLGTRSSLEQPGRGEAWFLFWALVGNFAQYFISGKHYSGYLTSDLWPFIFGGAAAWIMVVSRNLWPRWPAWGGVLAVAGCLAYSLLCWINLPWVHPLKQIH